MPNFTLKTKKCSRFSHHQVLLLHRNLTIPLVQCQHLLYTITALFLLYFLFFSQITVFHSIHNCGKCPLQMFPSGEGCNSWPPPQCRHLNFFLFTSSPLLIQHIQLPLTKYWAGASSARQLSAPNTYLAPCKPSSCPGLPFAQCSTGC